MYQTNNTRSKMTSDEESYHSAQGTLSKLNSQSSNEEDNEIVPDSAGSSSESDNIASLNNELLFNNEIQLSDSSEDETDKDESSEKRSNDGLELPLSKRLRQRTVPTTAKLDRSVVLPYPNKNFKLLQESDLSKLSVDSEKLKAMSSLQSMIQQKTPDNKHSKSINEQAHNNKIKLLQNLANKDKIKKSLVDSIINETVTNKYHDWHFIKYNCSKTIDTSDLNHILKSIGCIQDYGDECRLVIGDQDLDKYDSYCTMLPVKYILDVVYDNYYNSALLNYDSRSRFFKFIICLLLDRKIYESVDIYDKNWSCVLSDLVNKKHCIKQLDYIKEFSEIFSELDEKLYFILYRLCSILPKMKPLLIKHYFKNNPQNLILEFNAILDGKGYEKLLYFIMFVYGSSLLPFEQDESNHSEDVKSKLAKNKVHLYFTDCIYDLAQTTTSEVEVSLIKSLLNIYSKII